MNAKIKILLAALLIAIVFNRENICEHLGFGKAKFHGPSISKKEKGKQDQKTGDFFVNDSLYRWNEQLLDWIPIEEHSRLQIKEADIDVPSSSPKAESIEISWKDLMDIYYRLRYFGELDMEIFAPEFPADIKALNDREIVIQGYVIPFDVEQEVLALSANSYASCFFCGQGSPASVMSLYLENEGKRYRVDEFTRFKGTLHLNSDDPEDFYYILRNAREE